MTAASSGSLDTLLDERPTPVWRKRWVWGGLAIAFLIVVAASWLLSGSARSGAYATEQVQNGDLEVTVSATGHLAPTNQVEVGSEVSGLVEDIFVEVNDRVSRGQVLARLDTSRLTDAVRRSEAQLSAANAAIAQAQAAYQLARSNLSRQEEVRRLSGGKVPAATEIDSTRAQVAQALAAVQSAQAQLAQARAQLSSDRTVLAKATIVSPVDGVVLSRDIERGQTLAASFNAPKLFVIAEDLSRMKLEASVDEADVGQVAPGQTANFTVDAYPGRRFPATISRINLGASSTSSSSSGSTASSASSSSVVSYTAVLSVANQDLTLRPGLTATASIVTANRHNVLLVSNAALRFVPTTAKAGGLMSAMRPGPMFGAQQKAGKVERGSLATLYTLDDGGQLKPLTVKVGATDGRITEVSGAGLTAGTRVVTSMLATKS